LDNSISLLRRQFLGTIKHTGGQILENGATVMKDLVLLRKLLAVRHHYLNEELYTKQVEAQAKAVAECRVFVVTPAQRNKWAANFTQWTSCLKTPIPMGLIVDECHQIGFEEGAATIGAASWAVFLGDESQSPGNLEEATPDAGTTSFILSSGASQNPGPQSRPLSQHNLMSWLLANKLGVSQFPLQETFRLGKYMLEVIQNAFPGKLDTATSIRPAEKPTLFLPVIFKGIDDWVYNKAKRAFNGGETVSSRLMLSHLLASFAYETILLVERRRTQPNSYISVVSYLVGVLDAVGKCFREHLLTMCTCLLRKSDIDIPVEGYGAYDFDLLVGQGAVQLLGVKKSGGFSGEVSFLITTHNTGAARAWAGDALKPHLLRIGLSRATDRSYLFIEDLTTNVQMASSSSAWNPLHDSNESNMAKHRKPWLNLISSAQSTWLNHLDIPDVMACVTTPRHLDPAPHMYSPKVFHQIAQEGEVGRLLSEAFNDTGNIGWLQHTHLCEKHIIIVVQKRSKNQPRQIV
jgi:hypothetical protein